jgi:glycosyltransferase involved in cell wall biosynthesis
MPPISGITITYNEEAHIAACIASLRQVCDDVVVVDSHSTDRTAEIAREQGARVVEQDFLGDGPQRNVAVDHADHDWILCLDADERADEEMVRTIRGLPLDPEVAYAFNRKSFVGRHWIDGPGFYPDHLTRLYNRQRATYEDRRMHATVVAPRVERVGGHILHYTYDDLSDWIGSIDGLSSWGARQLFESGRRPSKWAPTWRALAAGVRQLVLRGGIFRGLDGRTIAMTSMFHTYMKYLKLNELHERAREERSNGSPD